MQRSTPELNFSVKEPKKQYDTLYSKNLNKQTINADLDSVADERPSRSSKKKKKKKRLREIS